MFWSSEHTLWCIYLPSLPLFWSERLAALKCWETLYIYIERESESKRGRESPDNTDSILHWVIMVVVEKWFTVCV